MQPSVCACSAKCHSSLRALLPAFVSSRNLSDCCACVRMQWNIFLVSVWSIGQIFATAGALGLLVVGIMKHVYEDAILALTVAAIVTGNIMVLMWYRRGLAVHAFVNVWGECVRAISGCHAWVRNKHGAEFQVDHLRHLHCLVLGWSVVAVFFDVAVCCQKCL